MNQFDKIINHFKKKFDPSRIPSSVWNRAYKRYDTSVYENIEFVINPNTHQINLDAIFENTTPNQQTVYPFYEACANFIRQFGAEKWQFIPITNNGIHSLKLQTYQFNGFMALVPIIDENLKIMDKEMANCGYVRVRHYSQVINGNKWIVVLYNPTKKYSCDEYVRSAHVKTIYHFTPPYNIESIKRDGIIPKDAKGTNMYQGGLRSFHKIGDFRRDNHFIMAMLGKATVENKTFKYAVIPIETSLLPSNIHFYFDANENDAVYTNDVIPPQFIDFDKVEEIDIRDLR